jgi:hypothetical protein
VDDFDYIGVGYMSHTSTINIDRRSSGYNDNELKGTVLILGCDIFGYALHVKFISTT